MGEIRLEENRRGAEKKRRGKEGRKGEGRGETIDRLYGKHNYDGQIPYAKKCDVLFLLYVISCH